MTPAPDDDDVVGALRLGPAQIDEGLDELVHASRSWSSADERGRAHQERRSVVPQPELGRDLRDETLSQAGSGGRPGRRQLPLDVTVGQRVDLARPELPADEASLGHDDGVRIVGPRARRRRAPGRRPARCGARSSLRASRARRPRRARRPPARRGGAQARARAPSGSKNGVAATTAAAAVDLHLGRERPTPEPAEHDGLSERGRVEAGGHLTHDGPAVADHAALQWRRAGHGEAVEAAVVGERGGALEGPPAEEVRLVHLHRPVHAHTAGRAVELGVLAHDDVALLQAQPEQRLEPVGPHAEVGAGLQQRPPQRHRCAERVVELEAGFTGERQPHDVAVDPRHGPMVVAQEAGRVGQAEPAEQLGGAGPGHVDGAQRHRAVEHVDPQPPRLDPVPHPHLRRRRPARGEGQREAGVAVPADHPVVDEVAALVEHEGVARSARRDVVDVARVQALEGLDDVRAGHHQLPERGHVADADGVAHRRVLHAHVAVRPGPPPAAEAVHVGAEADVLVVQRSAAGGIQVVAGGGLAEGELAGGRAGGERLGRLLRAVGHERPQVGQAHRPLAGARAAQAGPLDQLQLGEAAAPHRLEVLHRRPRAGAHDTVTGRGRQRMLGGCGPDDGHGHAGGHAGQDVAGRGPETEDGGPAGVRPLDPFVVGSSPRLLPPRRRPRSPTRSRPRTAAAARTRSGTARRPVVRRWPPRRAGRCRPREGCAPRRSP